MSPGEGLKYDAMEQGYDININMIFNMPYFKR